MQTRLILGLALIFTAFFVVSVVTYFQTNEAYYTVDELVANPRLYATGAAAPNAAADAPVSGRRMQVRGDIDKATVRRGREGLRLEFTLAGNEHTLPVRYEGLVPDTFDLAAQVTVGGRVSPSGTFVADQLFVQCPSKYEAAPPGAATPATANG